MSGEGQGLPDGMKIDSQGNLYCTGPGGIHVFDQSADLMGVVAIPEYVANFTWGERIIEFAYYRINVTLSHACQGLRPGTR